MFSIAWSAPSAWESCSSLTTSRVSTELAGPNSAEASPSTTATSSSCQYCGVDQSAASGMLASVAQRTRSVAIITTRRFQRSTRAPAGSRKPSRVTSETVATRPAWTALPPRLSTSSGKARPEIAEPRLEVRLPRKDRRRFGLLQST